MSTLFPRPCPLCRKSILDDAGAFCPACLDGFQVIEEPLCSRCGYPLAKDTEAEGLLCPGCLSRESPLPPAYTVRSLALYAGGLRKAILRVKYSSRQTAVARSLSFFIRDHFSRFFPVDAFDRILPVPLHPKRLRAREFNQCVLLSRPLASHLGIPLDLDAVERVRHTLPQRFSTEKERRKNLKGAFRVRKPARIDGQSILLFDDVYTSGATLEEMARSLLSAGASRVAAFTLARSPREVFPVPAMSADRGGVDTAGSLL
jgi:ComF family protein